MEGLEFGVRRLRDSWSYRDELVEEDVCMVRITLGIPLSLRRTNPGHPSKTHINHASPSSRHVDVSTILNPPRCSRL